MKKILKFVAVLLVLNFIFISSPLSLAESSSGTASVQLRLVRNPITGEIDTYISKNGEWVLLKTFDPNDYKSNYEALIYLDILAGYLEDYTYKNGYNGSELITREEFIALAVRTAVGFRMNWGVNDGTPLNYTEKWTGADMSKFTDVEDRYSQYYDYVRAAYNLNISKGISNNKFGVGKTISSKDATFMILKALKLDVSYNNLLENNAKNMYNIYTDTDFGQKNLTKDGALELISKALLYKDINGVTHLEKLNDFNEVTVSNYLEIMEILDSK